MNLILFIVVYLVCSTGGLILLKLSLVKKDFKNIDEYVHLLMEPKFIVGFLLYIASFLLWLILLSKKDVSYMYPIVIGLSYISIMTMAIIILKEDLTIEKIIGASLICIGVAVIASQN